MDMPEVKTGKEAVRKTWAKVPLQMMTKNIHPLDLLKETIENRDWFKGLILSTTFFEMLGLIVLDSFFRQEKNGPEQHKIVTDFFDRLGLMKTIQLLYLCDFIELGTYRKKNVMAPLLMGNGTTLYGSIAPKKPSTGTWKLTLP